MSIWSLTYQQSVFKRYHSGKHFSGFLPTRWRQNSTGIDMKQSYVTVAPCIVKVKITTTGNTDNAFDCCRVERQKLRILTLPVEHAVRGLCSGRVSVRPSVCLFRQSTAAAAADEFAAERWRYISIDGWHACTTCGQRHVESRGTRLNTLHRHHHRHF